MIVGLIDVDSHNYPNFALMKISAYHKAQGDTVEWAKKVSLFDRVEYDVIYCSKIFTFSPDIDTKEYIAKEWKFGGTGYDIKSKLQQDIEDCRLMDYTIYPQYPFSIQFFSRGCIRHCPFCLVHDKEGYIHNATPHDLNPNGKWIEIFDNNFFANPNWRDAAEYLLKVNKPVNFHGVDVRIMDEEQAEFLNKLKHQGSIHIAWDLPQIDLRPQLEKMVKYIKPYKISCYILVGFNSTKEQDLFRARELKKLGIVPFAQAYRDFNNDRIPTQYERDFCRWCNSRALFKSADFLQFMPRKGFVCSYYFDNAEC